MRLIATKPAELTQSAISLEAKPGEAFGEARIFASSSNFTLGTWPDGYTYGWLSYAFGRLKVGCRTSEDDSADMHDGTPKDEKTCTFQALSSCPVCLLNKMTIESPLDNIATELAQQEAEFGGTLSVLQPIGVDFQAT